MLWYIWRVGGNGVKWSINKRENSLYHASSGKCSSDFSREPKPHLQTTYSQIHKGDVSGMSFKVTENEYKIKKQIQENGGVRQSEAHAMLLFPMT